MNRYTVKLDDGRLLSGRKLDFGKWHLRMPMMVVYYDCLRTCILTNWDRWFFCENLNDGGYDWLLVEVPFKSIEAIFANNADVITELKENHLRLLVCRECDCSINDGMGYISNLAHRGKPDFMEFDQGFEYRGGLSDFHMNLPLEGYNFDRDEFEDEMKMIAERLERMKDES